MILQDGLPPPAQALLATAYVAVLVTATWTDLRARRIPNALTLPASVAALALAVWQGAALPAFGGAVIGALAFILPMGLYGMSAAGGGDVKLAFFLGAALGLPALLGALFWAGLAGSVIVLGGLATRRLTRRSPVPFAPFLAVGGLVALLVH
jgi:prepilin signal peptidase PulO-like enzyme (type II secretory pathway)